ncbi:MAG: SDR family NAD(P)-dependent oxidoreductase, partial [Parvularculaceae bacterium]|nr:SDR family NAD(P)-dependent oxidoreductase [Parvularculaceae bacterium]
MAGETAIITGAGSGIGYGAALRLAARGMSIVGIGRDPGKLEALQKAIGDPTRVATLSI